MNEDQLYQDLGYIKAKVEKIDCLEKKIDGLDKRLEGVERKMVWVFGWASGVALAATFVWTYLKDKILRII